ncbi:hypothetical protein LguiA_022919 [Lonicera macranthoides]
MLPFPSLLLSSAICFSLTISRLSFFLAACRHRHCLPPSSPSHTLGAYIILLLLLPTMGLESSADWDDHQRIFGFDGQDFQYPGAQVESLPYVYYTPSYGYSQSAYNPYNPYIPGAMMGADVPFLVVQQYYTIPSYENAISSPAYFPMVVQSIPDINSNITSAHTAIKADGPVFKNKSSPASAISTLNPQRNASSQATLPRVPEGSKANVVPSKQPLNVKIE